MNFFFDENTDFDEIVRLAENGDTDALKSCTKAAEIGHRSSQEALSSMYLYGKGVEQNKQAAYMWLYYKYLDILDMDGYTYDIEARLLGIAQDLYYSEVDAAQEEAWQKFIKLNGRSPNYYEPMNGGKLD